MCLCRVLLNGRSCDVCACVCPVASDYQDVGWHAIVSGWLHRIPSRAVRRVVSECMEEYAPKSLAVLGAITSPGDKGIAVDSDAEPADITQPSLLPSGVECRCIASVIRMFEGSLACDGVSLFAPAEGDAGLSTERVASLRKYFVFALVWGLAGSLPAASTCCCIVSAFRLPCDTFNCSSPFPPQARPSFHCCSARSSPLRPSPPCLLCLVWRHAPWLSPAACPTQTVWTAR